MDAIKKKMQAMKIERDNAFDRADTAEEKAKQQLERVEKVHTYCIRSTAGSYTLHQSNECAYCMYVMQQV